MNNRVLPVEFEEFEVLLRFAQSQHNNKGEPIPSIGEENIGKITSCLRQPFQTWGGKYLYAGFIDKAAILFYLIVKGHSLQNGNKRMAILTLNFFYYKNGAQLTITDRQIYKLAKATAMSTDQDAAVRTIKAALRRDFRDKKRKPLW